MSDAFYSAPSYMSGGYIVYGERRRQRGAGIMGSFRKYMAPIGRQAFKGIKQVARSKTMRRIGKAAAAKGAEVLTGVAVDALTGQNVGESFKNRTRDVALRTLTGEEQQQRRQPQGRKRHIQKLKQTPNTSNLITSTARAPPWKKRRIISRAALNRNSLF